MDELIEYQPQVTKVLSEARFRFKSLVQFSTRLRISSLLLSTFKLGKKGQLLLVAVADSYTMLLSQLMAMGIASVVVPPENVSLKSPEASLEMAWSHFKHQNSKFKHPN